VSHRIANFDGEIPRIYDACLGPVLFDPYADDLARRVAAENLGDVLELACGTGILTRHLLANLSPATRIVATDLSDDMVDYARGKLGTSERLEWRQANAMELPFANASFDAVVCQFGWMFMPDKAVAVREVRRVLRPGGTFLFNVWDSLAHNDLPRVVQATLEERFPDHPPQFLPVAFGYHQRHVITATLESAGFSQVTLVEVAKRSVRSSARQVATGLITGTPVRYALLQLGNSNEMELIDAIAARLAKEFGDPPTNAKLLALVVTAGALTLPVPTAPAAPPCVS
jgi:ubiquinone/menaquinone biosynthesis C-methylase UbiE